MKDGKKPDPGRPVRIKDVAAAAGVSPSTVSYALRDYHRLSKETIAKVKAAAGKLGYKPSPVMSALAEHRWRKQAESKAGFSTLALVHAYRPEEWPGLLNRQRLFASIKQRAGELGYELKVFDAGQTAASQKRLSQILYSRGIEGVFVAPHLYEDRSVPVALDWSRFCAISVLNEQPERALHAVLPSWVRNRLLVLEQLAALPEVAIGTFVTKTLSGWTGGLSETFSLPLDHLDGTPDHWVPTHVADGYDKNIFLRWYRKFSPRVVVTNIENVPDWIRECGAQVPEERGVVFIDTVQEGWRSGIDIHPTQIGRTAMNLMHDLLRGMRTGIPEYPYRTTVPGTWQEGATFRSWAVQVATAPADRKDSWSTFYTNNPKADACSASNRGGSK